jgi:hypothetical protein
MIPSHYLTLSGAQLSPDTADVTFRTLDHDEPNWFIAELQDSVAEFHEGGDIWMLEESLYATSLDDKLGYEQGEGDEEMC